MTHSIILDNVKKRNPNEPEFLQAAEEVIASVLPVLEKNPEFARLKLLERMLEPERLISFRVTWLDDKGEVQVNRGYRVQMNSAIGPYKGGLRFHPTVTPSVLKFLAFEQVFKNALTGIPMGGGKGGSDFDPKGKSDNEVMKFCQAFMGELARHIGHRLDVPAGDIGVGGREIGFLFGAYKKIRNEFTGVLTGKGIGWGGSLIRTEATGYGLIYFAENMLQNVGSSIKGKTCLVSGSGNVSQYAIEKIIQLGGKAITASDSNGVVVDEAGFTMEKLEFLKDLKNNRRGRIKEYADKYKCTYQAIDAKADHNPLWNIKADCAFPCATQNEINAKDAGNLVKNGVKLLAEGANMPTTIEGINIVLANGMMYAPGKASNAGGVATSGLEMTQNFMGANWTPEEVDAKLVRIMKDIHDTSLAAAKEYGSPGNYMAGANIAGFIKVAKAMQAQGVI
ncbi:MAG: NADP-specific glutamate dehydrogenase [Cytophagales bacterium]|jgi:glutamate dehydrogenase (NADP+)|nr:NADP-specific glutamate dehydrogenase [Cytophagales bacterium]MCA6386720.1 NADP-specific glutamate dehydrogenase [Cytophagales bacterium]MCA6392475.1 NADP-specific glutamate dehydrogenase [Cytophagales bacterium]MCA6394215.1 NADP-specific glutamate dehydrogenase [Cytophagales bacterium]MCA6398947.1 NADP-specific glutamate dehydrogenase [Cytophagales bacterium]